MLNVIHNVGKTGIKWQVLFGMFADKNEDELLKEVASLKEAKKVHEIAGIIYPGPPPKRFERSKLLNYNTNRIGVYRRQEQQAKGRSFDIYLHESASSRLSLLAETWGCNQSEAIERLIMEANEC